MASSIKISTEKILRRFVTSAICATFSTHFDSLHSTTLIILILIYLLTAIGLSPGGKEILTMLFLDLLNTIRLFHPVVIVLCSCCYCVVLLLLLCCSCCYCVVSCCYCVVLPVVIVLCSCCYCVVLLFVLFCYYGVVLCIDCVYCNTATGC